MSAARTSTPVAMRSLHPGSNAFVAAIVTALAAGGMYLLIARSIEPDTMHWGAATVIGLTLGIHIYSRTRLKIVRSAYNGDGAR